MKMSLREYIRRLAISLLAVSSIATNFLNVSADQDTLIVNTEKGQVRGFIETVNGKNVEVFYGIPYAKPPLGDLRYQPTVENDPWQGVLDATQLPNSCFQTYDTYFQDFTGSTMWNPNTPSSEDCLYLNVWVPRTNPPYKDKAVIVWFYGGGFYSGSSTLDIYQASYLAAENDIIVVSFQYRVGSLGFLVLDTPEAPGNAGIWDQRMALEWVSRNIQNFGGSSNNVTLMGESAGAVSVGIFLMCDLCRGYYQRAILQSGSPVAKWGVLPKENMIKRAEQLANVSGCNQLADHDELVKCLRLITYSSTFMVAEFIPGVLPFGFGPIVDGCLLRQDPAQLLRTGNFKKIPILLGSNDNEASFFIAYTNPNIFNLDYAPSISKHEYNTLMRETMFKFYPYFPNEINDIGFEAIKFFYRDWLYPENETSLLVSMDRAVSDFNFVCPVNELARTYAKYNMPVYYYWFSQRWSANPWPEWMGVLHADEIWFTFGHPLNHSYSFTEEEIRLSRLMMAYWTNFAKTGNPNIGPQRNESLPEWPVFKQNEQRYLKLSVDSFTSGDHWGQGPRAQQCAFWDDFLPKLVPVMSDISEVEKEWKRQFHEWKTHYIVDWKTQFDNFISSYKSGMGACSGGRP